MSLKSKLFRNLRKNLNFPGKVPNASLAGRSIHVTTTKLTKCISPFQISLAFLPIKLSKIKRLIIIWICMYSKCDSAFEVALDSFGEHLLIRK